MGSSSIACSGSNKPSMDERLAMSRKSFDIKVIHKLCQNRSIVRSHLSDSEGLKGRGSETRFNVIWLISWFNLISRLNFIFMKRYLRDQASEVNMQRKLLENVNMCKYWFMGFNGVCPRTNPAILQLLQETPRMSRNGKASHDFGFPAKRRGAVLKILSLYSTKTTVNLS